jgi:hypothetical protein
VQVVLRSKTGARLFDQLIELRQATGVSKIIFEPRQRGRALGWPRTSAWRFELATRLSSSDYPILKTARRLIRMLECASGEF